MTHVPPRLHSTMTCANSIRGKIIGLSSNSALRTFELRLDPLSEQWLLESIDDGS